MRSLVFIIPTLIGGGMERVVSEFSNYYAKSEEYQVTILMYGNNIGTNYSLSDKVKIITPKRSFDKRFRIFSGMWALFFLRFQIRKLAPDYAISFGEYWNNFVLLSVLFTSRKIFVADRCQPDKYLGRMHEFLRQKLYPKSAGFIVQTVYAKKYFEGRLRNTKIHVLPNPINYDNTKVSDSEREKIVLSVGRLIDSKNFDVLIRIFSKVRQPGWKLVIVGDNVNDPLKIINLKALTQELNVQNFVELVGHQSDVSAFYRRAEIFAFTSKSEGFPNVLIEAMSFNLPVIAYDCPAGPSDIIIDTVNGYLIPLDNETEFSNSLETLMKNDTLCRELGVNAGQSISRFSLNSVALSLTNILTNK